MTPPASPDLYIERPHPIITSRIEFKPIAPRPLPLLTSCIEFTAERLAYTGAIANEHEIDVGTDQDPDRTPDQTPPRINLPRLIGGRATAATKVPKPPGEPGRPGSGGYCVETELIKTHKWSKDSVDKLTEAVRTLARKKLDVTVSLRSQNKATIRGICDQMMQDDRWPLLKNYDDCWPVRSILKLTLKYRAEASRRAAAKSAHARMRAILRGESPPNDLTLE